MFALEGPHVCATGADTPGGSDCANDVVARASSTAAGPDMIQYSLLPKSTLQERDEQKNLPTLDSYLFPSTPCTEYLSIPWLR